MKTDTSAAFVGDASQWAEERFGRCKLGDPRRTRRVVEYAARQAVRPEGSTNAVCSGDGAAAEGAYRMIRNPLIDPQALEEGPISYVAEQCANRKTVLAIQDTTTLSISSAVAEQLGELGKDGSGGRGFLVHTTLAVDAETEEPMGLLDQERWQRSDERPGKETRKSRAYRDKESFKWEAALERVRGRVASMANIITVADRESDIYEFLSYIIAAGLRFVVRAAQDRTVDAEEGCLWEHMSQRPVIGTYDVTIGQRGGQHGGKGQNARSAREKRVTKLEIRTATINVLPPRNRKAGNQPIEVNAVLAREVDAPAGEKALEWMLLTSEPVSTKRKALEVIRFYELRWLIEEYFKAWKSGCRIENRPVQQGDTLERLAVITGQVAVRLLQLRAVGRTRPERPCTEFLSSDEWRCLWASAESGKRSPGKPPTVLWAVQAIAKLGGWRDTKRTGRIGWTSLWIGWAKFEDRLVGWRLAMQAAKM